MISQSFLVCLPVTAKARAGVRAEWISAQADMPKAMTLRTQKMRFSPMKIIVAPPARPADSVHPNAESPLRGGFVPAHLRISRGADPKEPSRGGAGRLLSPDPRKARPLEGSDPRRAWIPKGSG